MYWIDLATEVVVLNSQVVPNSHVVVKTGFTVSLTPISIKPAYITSLPIGQKVKHVSPVALIINLFSHS